MRLNIHRITICSAIDLAIWICCILIRNIWLYQCDKPFIDVRSWAHLQYTWNINVVYFQIQIETIAIQFVFTETIDFHFSLLTFQQLNSLEILSWSISKKIKLNIWCHYIWDSTTKIENQMETMIWRLNYVSSNQ